MEIVERFINYTKFDTQSAEDSETVPSTPKQLIFAKYLQEELEREGLKDVAMDSFGTACNVTGDGAIALAVNKFFGKKKESSVLS